MNKLLTLLVGCVLLFGISNALEFKDCGSETGKFSSVKLPSCDESANACVLKRNTNATIEVDFNLIDGEEVPEVTTIVHGIIQGVEMPFPLKNPDACLDSGLACPLQKDINYEYVQTLQVLKIYPKIEQHDDLPTNICTDCFEKLQQFYQFRVQIKRSDKILRCSKVSRSSTVQEGTVDTSGKNAEIDVNTGIDSTACVVCLKIFTDTTRMQIHLIRKHSVRSDKNMGKEYECKECEKVYTTRANLTLHERTHSGLKAFQCNVCGRGFYDEKALRSHKSIHTGLKQWKCNCGKQFTTANILQQHRKKHLPQRPHRCSECPRDFHTANELRVHFRMHTQEQPYLCCQCGKQFTRKTHLNIHMRTHTGVKPFKCQFCEKSFALSGDLTAHIRIHTGVRPYECHVCQKTFNQSSARNIHMRIHTRARDYICNVCGAAFTQSASLKRHVKTHINSDLINGINTEIAV